MTMACISKWTSAIAAERQSFMFMDISCRLPRHSGWLEWEPEIECSKCQSHSGFLLEELGDRLEAYQEAFMSIGWEWNSSGILRLSCMLVSRGSGRPKHSYLFFPWWPSRLLPQKQKHPLCEQECLYQAAILIRSQTKQWFYCFFIFTDLGF